MTDLVLGAKLRDNPYMKRGRALESQVVEVVERKLGMSLSSSGSQLDPLTPLIGASPDAINKDFVVEIKCPSSDKTVNNYITKKGDLKAKYYSQIQLQMHMAKREKGLFCLANPNFEENKEVNIINVNYDKEYVLETIQKVQSFWNSSILPCTYVVISHLKTNTVYTLTFIISWSPVFIFGDI